MPSLIALLVLDDAGGAGVGSVLDLAFVSGIVNAFLHLHFFGNAEHCVASSFASAARYAFVAGFVQPNFRNSHNLPLVSLVCVISTI